MEDDSSHLLMFLMELRKQGIVDNKLLKTLETIPFYHFSHHAHALRNAINSAKLFQALALHERSITLEAGRNTGYHTALLSKLSRRVVSTSSVTLYDNSLTLSLEKFSCSNITLVNNAADQGWAEAAPYDAILVNQPMPKVPAELLDQLHDHGKMLLPLGSVATHMQWILITKNDGQFHSQKLEHISLSDIAISAA